MATIDLCKLPWTLTGWRPNAWRLRSSRELGLSLLPDIPEIRAQVPGSAQRTLCDAGVIRDWHLGVASRECEWVERRHWEFSTVIPADAFPPDQNVTVLAEGLDPAGWLLIDDKVVAAFNGPLIPHHFDLQQLFADHQPHRLSLIFDSTPDEQGQMGYTSRSRHFKPRYNYGWDWVPRIVPVGPWCYTMVRCK